MTKHQAAKPATRERSDSDNQPTVPDTDKSGLHTLEGLASAATVHGKVGDQVITFLENLLLHDDKDVVEGHLLAEDVKKLHYLRTLARIASRGIRIFCVPVSEIAASRLKHELEKIKNSALQTATWHGKTKWWLSDTSTQITGEDRAQRLVSRIIRSETQTHAFDCTARKKVPKHQKHHDHSLFRQLAESFSPPRASKEAISSNQSNHPVAGASRKVGVTATRDALIGAGFEMFDESISGAARDKKATGRREVHGVKDLQHLNPDGEHKPGMVYTFVDQDMYIDSFERYAGENMVIITPEYNKLAGVGTDSVWYYTVTAQDEVVVTERVTAAGGATYSNQRPWDYASTDFIYIEHYGKSAFTTYNVCIQHQPGTHHKWVWLARNTTTKLSKAVCDLMCNAAQGAPLEGLTLNKASNVVVVRGESKLKQEIFLMGLFGDTDCPTYSIKYAHDMGPNTSMELSENQYRVFTLMGKNRPKGYGVSEVMRTMKFHTIWRPGGLEPLLVSFFSIPIEYRPRPNIMYTTQDGSLDDGVAEEGTATEGAPNIAGGGPGVAETKSDAAHEAYELKRLREYQNKTDPAANIKDVVSLLLPRFLDLISRETAVPLKSVPLQGRQVIYDRRTQRLQAARLQRHVELVANLPMPKTNLKHEVAAKASAAPRGITQYTEENAIQTGRVGLLCKEVLKGCAFYKPGSSPHDIALSVRHLCQMALEAAGVNKQGGQVSGLHDTDYSKMDETISEYIYSWFVEFVLAFVHPSDYEEVKKILAENVDFITLLNGKPISTGFKNNSGSGVTTELNTFVSAFVEYVSTCLAITKYTTRSNTGEEKDLSTVTRTAVRNALKNYLLGASDLTHVYWGDFMFKNGHVDVFSIPYSTIGPKFGDDGVAPHLPCISDCDWAAAATFFTGAIGMVLKVSFSKPEDGTFFLGRYYPQPLVSLASYADVLKAVRKISIARNLDVEKYKMKLLGYWTTDSKTPVIREYLMAVARLYDVKLHCYEVSEEESEDGTPVLSLEMMRLLATDRDMFYRVAGGPYCVSDEDVPMMIEAIAPQVNFDNSSELEAWLESIAKCATWEELDNFMLPGMDFDPDAEPEGTTRMSGPVANLFSAKEPPSTIGRSLAELAVAAEVALSELLEDEETGSKTSECVNA